MWWARAYICILQCGFNPATVNWVIYWHFHVYIMLCCRAQQHFYVSWLFDSNYQQKKRRFVPSNVSSCIWSFFSKENNRKIINVWLTLYIKNLLGRFHRRYLMLFNIISFWFMYEMKCRTQQSWKLITLLSIRALIKTLAEQGFLHKSMRTLGKK